MADTVPPNMPPHDHRPLLEQDAILLRNSLRLRLRHGYGLGWMGQVLDDLGLRNDRELRRWLAGTRPTPTWVWRSVADMLAQQASMSLKALEHVREYLSADHPEEGH